MNKLLQHLEEDLQLASSETINIKTNMSFKIFSEDSQDQKQLSQIDEKQANNYISPNIIHQSFDPKKEGRKHKFNTDARQSLIKDEISYPHNLDKSKNVAFIHKEKISFKSYQDTELKDLRSSRDVFDNLKLRQQNTTQSIISALPSIMINKGSLDEKTSKKLDLVEKLIGKLKEGKQLKKRYLQMVLSASVNLDQEKIDRVTQSKNQQAPIEILDKKLLQPDPELERFIQINPHLVQKSVQIEDIKSEQEKYKSLMAKHRSLTDILQDEQVKTDSDRLNRGGDGKNTGTNDNNGQKIQKQNQEQQIMRSQSLSMVEKSNSNFIIPDQSSLQNFIKRTDIIEGIKQKCLQEFEASSHSSKLITAQNRIKALANSIGVGIDTYKSEDQVRKSFIKKLNDRIRLKNKNSASPHQIEENLSQLTPFDNLSFESTPNLSLFKPLNNIYSRGATIKGGLTYLQSQQTLNPKIDGDDSPIMNQKITKSKTLKGVINKSAIQSIPDFDKELVTANPLQNQSSATTVALQPKNFEIKLKSLEIIHAPLPFQPSSHQSLVNKSHDHSQNYLRDKISLKNKQLNAQFIVQDDKMLKQLQQQQSETNNEFFKVFRQVMNSRNDGQQRGSSETDQILQRIHRTHQLTHLSQPVEYQQIKQHLHNEYVNLTLTSNQALIPKRLRHQISKSLLTESSVSENKDRLQITQDTQISDSFYARFPQLVQTQQYQQIQLKKLSPTQLSKKDLLTSYDGEISQVVDIKNEVRGERINRLQQQKQQARTSIFEKIGEQNNREQKTNQKDKDSGVVQRKVSDLSDFNIQSEQESPNELTTGNEKTSNKTSKGAFENETNQNTYQILNSYGFQPAVNKFKPAGFNNNYKIIQKRRNNSNTQNQDSSPGILSVQNSHSHKSSLDLKITQQAIESYRRKLNEESSNDITMGVQSVTNVGITSVVVGGLLQSTTDNKNNYYKDNFAQGNINNLNSLHSSSPYLQISNNRHTIVKKSMAAERIYNLRDKNRQSLKQKYL